MQWLDTRLALAQSTFSMQLPSLVFNILQFAADQTESLDYGTFSEKVGGWKVVPGRRENSSEGA